MRSGLWVALLLCLSACAPPRADELTGSYRLEHGGAQETLQLRADGTCLHRWQGGEAQSTWVLATHQSGCPGTRIELRDYTERVDAGFGIDGRAMRWNACFERNLAGEVFVTIGDPDSGIAYWRED